MNDSQGHKISSILSILFLLIFTASAQPYTNQIGLTVLQVTTPGVNGTGVRVGQPEANLGGEPSQFEVNPVNQGQPTNLFTYVSADGTAGGFPNSVGLVSGHAGSVAIAFYGLPAGVATNVAHVDNFDADYYFTNIVENLLPAQGDTIVNQSFDFTPALDASDQEQVDSFYDNYEETFHTLFVSGIGNGTNVSVNAPGTSYNCIAVGAYFNFFNFTCVGPTIDNGRSKPDVTAINVADSFSTPEVSGAAADLMQAAMRGDGGSDTNSAFNLRTIKALILNGAVKPSDWNHIAPAPLDFRYGTGLLNVFNSYEELVGGKHACIVSNLVTAGGSHPPTGDSGTISVLSGWDFATNTSSTSPAKDAVRHYYFNVSNNVPAATFTATATLVWNRQLHKSAINQLSLFLYNCANNSLVTGSTSLVDNVQHIYLPALAQGRYDLQVWKAGGSGIVSMAEPYALAFAFTSTALQVAYSGTNVVLTWPVYPAGFEVQATTNLISPGWTNASLPLPVIMNNTNTLTLSQTNAYQFFRLHQPNF